MQFRVSVKNVCVRVCMSACAVQATDKASSLGEQHDDGFCEQIMELGAVYQGHKLILHVPS